VRGGFAGVDIFFVISGFLITGIILRALRRDGFSFFDFYPRRIRRIFPALIVVLLSVWALGWLKMLPDEYSL
jgi:peptidoglycan/LPS O-acetylase OafA/YrhL